MTPGRRLLHCGISVPSTSVRVKRVTWVSSRRSGDVRYASDSVAKVGRVARLGPFFEFLIVGFAFPSGKTDKPPPSTLTPRMLLALAAHDRGIWPTASSSVPLRSAAPRPWRHSSLVVGVDRV
jgi:hypothetical protein